jgi:hypothetical protein
MSCALAALMCAGSLAAFERNSGKYGAMFYWWYTGLPAGVQALPQFPWDARDAAWWSAVVREARDGGLGYLAADAWGADTTADPALLAPLIAAIDRSAPGLKVALFDDTTSEVLRKNQARGHGWTRDVRFDLSDLAGTGEGGLRYFYDEQWKRFFQTVPAQYRLTIDGRPVVFMWHGGFEWYTRQDSFHTMIEALREATRRDFNVDPFVIVEESWSRLDPALRVEGLFDWFEPGRSFATLMPWSGFRVGQVVPGYDCRDSIPPVPVVARQDGRLYQAGLEAVAPGSDLVLIDGIDNLDENAQLLSSPVWGRLYLAITKWFAANVP